MNLKQDGSEEGKKEREKTTVKGEKKEIKKVSKPKEEYGERNICVNGENKGGRMKWIFIITSLSFEIARFQYSSRVIT